MRPPVNRTKEGAARCGHAPEILRLFQSCARGLYLSSRYLRLRLQLLGQAMDTVETLVQFLPVRSLVGMKNFVRQFPSLALQYVQQQLHLRLIQIKSAFHGHPSIRQWHLCVSAVRLALHLARKGRCRFTMTTGGGDCALFPVGQEIFLKHPWHTMPCTPR